MNFITYAEPYNDKPLKETWDDTEDEISGGPARNNRNRLAAVADKREQKAGKWARRFVEEVNNAMEDRDTQLTLVAVSTFNSRPFSILRRKISLEIFADPLRKRNGTTSEFASSRRITNIGHQLLKKNAPVSSSPFVIV